MGGKNFIGSFSYNVKDSEIVDECTRIAKQDGISFSEFVVACLKEQIAQKKVRGSPNPLNVYYGKPEEKPSHNNNNLDTPTLDQWISKLKDMEDIREIASIQGHHNRVVEKCKIRINQLKAKGIGLL